MANPLSKPAGNGAPRWVYQAILVEMTDKTLYDLRATQRHKEIRGIFNGGIWPHGMSVLTFRGSRGYEGTLGKHPLWNTTKGRLLILRVLIPCVARTAVITQHKKEQMTNTCIMFLTNKIENINQCMKILIFLKFVSVCTISKKP